MTSALAADPLPRWASRVLAPNPGPFTGAGTNTWVLGGAEPGFVVVDPGPDHDGHLAAVAATVAGAPCAVLITHRHPDHVEGIDGLRKLLPAAPVYAREAAHCRDTSPVEPGVLPLPTCPGLDVEVIDTPGHTDDSVSFVVHMAGEAAGVLVTGDTVLGAGSSVIAHPDGNVGTYLTSLGALLRTCDAAPGPIPLLPGHGPAHENAADVVASYALHRVRRIAQTDAALTADIASLTDLADAVYPDVPAALRAATTASVHAHVVYLAEHGNPHAERLTRSAH